MLWPDHENFLQATLYEKMRFLPFSSKNCKIQQCLMVFCVSKFQKKGRICGFHWTFRSKKCFSFRGAKPLWPPTRGSAPGPRWGLRPRPPLYSRAPRARHAPLCQILNTPLVVHTQSWCRGKFIAPGKLFPPPYCHNVTDPNPNPTPNPNPKFNPILNINRNQYCCVWE